MGTPRRGAGISSKDRHTPVAVSKRSSKKRACCAGCILTSKRIDFQTCVHLNPVVVLTDLGNLVKENKKYIKKIHQTEPTNEQHASALEPQTILTKVKDEPVTKEPVTNESVTNDTVTKEPVTNESVTNDTVTNEPVTNDTVQSDKEIISEVDQELNQEESSEAKTPSKRNRKRKLSWDPNLEYEVDKILGYKRHKRHKMLYVVQWKNYDNCTTLEPIENLTGCIYELMIYLERNSQPTQEEISNKDKELKEMLKERPSFKQLKKNDWALSNLQLYKTLDVEEIFRSDDLDELEANTSKQYWYIVRCLIGMSDNQDPGLVDRGLDYLTYLELIKQRKNQLKLLHDAEVAINKVEKVALTLENNFDFDVLPDLKYVTKMVVGENVELPGPLLGCKCKRGCCSKSQCCGKLAGSFFPYDNFGRLRFQEKMAIYECNSKCKCDKTCFNRVVQKGRRFELGIYKTKNCGWGVKALENIPKGSFVCEYFGELIRNSEAQIRDIEYFRQGKSYVFNLDFDGGHKEMFCIDATVYGNVSRFINHSCNPNLMVLPVWVDCLEVNLHRLAFFAIKDIASGQEITFDYESADDNNQQNIETENEAKRISVGLECLCGEEKCRKWLFSS